MLSIAASLLGVGKWLREAISDLFGWVAAHPWQAALCTSLALLWWQTSALNGVRKDLLAMTRARDAEKAAHITTKTNYRREQAIAAESDRRNAQRVKREQATAIKSVETKYATEMSYARASLAERLRTSPTRTCSVSGGEGAAMSSVPALSRGPVPASGEAIIHVADAELGAGNTLRLEALIEAWRAAERVNINEPQ